MDSNNLAIMVYGNADSGRDALTEDKYKELAIAFSLQGFNVKSVLYHDELRDKLLKALSEFDAVLVWVNPIEQGNDRRKLDSLLAELSNKGCFVSAHPDVILKMGTKEVLYKTKDMDWGGDIELYRNYEDFTRRFIPTLKKSSARVLKQYRGNGGSGVFKVIFGSTENEVLITHAKSPGEKIVLQLSDFYKEFESYYLNNGMLIDQAWNKNITNGMVRCYLSGTKVAGFGFQEINMLYQLNNDPSQNYFTPSKRYYFTENCVLFNDLKELMETKWVPELQKILSISTYEMPVIWDADFLINDINSRNAHSKYSLCEINVSCVSPFPPSAIRFIVNEVGNKIRNKKSTEF
jgi:hypothetical protein